MDLAEVCDLVRAVARLDDGSDRAEVTAGFAKLTRLRAWCDSREVKAGRLLARECAYPEKVMADAARTSLRDARRVINRATTIDEVPSFDEAMAAGQVGAAHLDVVGAALRQFDGEERRELATRLDRLVGVASVATPDEWARRVRAEIQKIDDDDGEKRHARQRAAMRLSSRVDRVTGMGKLWASLDPLSYVKVSNRIDALVEALFAERAPEGCPSDPLEKQAYLRALAFVALCEGRGAAMGRPEFTVVIDTRSLDDEGRPVVDWGLPVDVPPSVLTDLARRRRCRRGDRARRRGAARSGPTRPRAQHPAREPLAAEGAAGAVPHLCDPRLPSAVRELQGASRPVVAAWRPHRPREPVAGLCATSPRDPRRGMARRAGA